MAEKDFMIGKSVDKAQAFPRSGLVLPETIA
jgi:hypothetical protein